MRLTTCARSGLPLLSHTHPRLRNTIPARTYCCCPAGPFYLTLTGPKDAFPDLTDPVKLAAVKEAVKSALKLDNSYSLYNIQVWLEVEKEVTAPAPAPTPTRRLQTSDNTVCSAACRGCRNASPLHMQGALCRTHLEVPELVRRNLSASVFTRLPFTD
jgi:hypothetical protein